MPIAIRNSKIDISSEETTRELGKKFSNFLKGGEIIFLYGEIGVGKTTFVKYLINSFQQKNKDQKTEVTSPTFSILNEYQLKSLTINHFDLFRLNKSNELKNIGLFENYKKTLTLIEWPEKIENKPSKKYEFFFKYDHKTGKRFLNILRNGLNLNL